MIKKAKKEILPVADFVEQMLGEIEKLGLVCLNDRIELEIENYFTYSKEKDCEQFIQTMMSLLVRTMIVPGIFLLDKELFKRELGLVKEFGEITPFFFEFLTVTQDVAGEPFTVYFDYVAMESKIKAEGYKLSSSFNKEYEELSTVYQLRTTFQKEKDLDIFMEVLETEVLNIQKQIETNKRFLDLQTQLKHILKEEYENRVKDSSA